MADEGRIVGVDAGEVRIGIAVSDPLGIIASPREVIKCSTPEADVAAIANIVTETEAILIVVGLPLDQNGQPGPQAEKVMAFIERLRAVVNVPIDTMDERFTTALVQRVLIQANVSRKGRKQVIDKVAAQQILQTYLDRRARQKSRERFEAGN